jgi:hypothetical protein
MAATNWVLGNCRFAAFNAPPKGARIELDSRPGEYVMVEEVTTGRDARGQQFWQARVTDKSGQTRTIHSDNVKSWKNYAGSDQYKWDLFQQDVKRRKEQESMIGGFEEKNRFQNGVPLAPKPGRPLMVRVRPNATGVLAVFSDELLMVDSVDYATGMASLTPVTKSVEQDPAFMALLKAVPASEIVSQADPTINERAASEVFRLPDGSRKTSAETMAMTPGLNEAAAKGRARIYAQVYMNYTGRQGKGGEAIFLEDLADRADPSELESMYTHNNTVQKYNADGSKANLRGAWSAFVVVDPPISPQMRAEAEILASKSQVFPTRDNEGNFRQNVPMTVHSNDLFKNMLSMGLMPAKRPVKA